MDETQLAVLVVCVFVILLLLIYLCCYEHKRLVYPWVKWKYYRSLCLEEGWLIKRCEQDNQTVRDVENQIINRNQLREITWDQDLDDGQTPVVVFCVHAARIGIDIKSALRGVRNHRPVLVVLHCKNKSSLRGDLSDDDYLLDQALRDRVTGIAHFAFSDFEGFYSCRQNEDGFRKLRELLTRLD